MAEKISLLKKDKEHGGQKLTLNTTECQIVLSHDENCKQIIEEAIKGGYYVVSVGANGNYVHYISKTADGFFREVTSENYHRLMPIYPFVDNAKWIGNIDKYFDMLIEDDDAITELEAIFGDKVFDAIGAVHKTIRAMQGDVLKSGTRPANVYKYLKGYMLGRSTKIPTANTVVNRTPNY